MTRKEQAEHQRLKIMKHALRLFIKKGRVATTIQDIATSSEMSVGLLYNYFESKDKLYEELIRVGVSGPNSIMNSKVLNPIEFFEVAAKTILEYLEDEYVSQMFVLMSQALNDDGLSEEIKKLLASQDNITASVEIIKKGQELLEIKSGDPLALSSCFWCAIQGIAEQKARTPQLPLPSSSWLVDIIRR